MEAIAQRIKELSLISKKEWNDYISNDLDLLKKDLDDIRDGIRKKLNGNYSNESRNNYL